MKKRYALILISVVCIGMLIYFNKTDESKKFGNGTLNDPYVLSDYEDNENVKNNKKVAEYLDQAVKTTLEIRPNQSNDSQNILSYYYGIYEVDKIHEENEIIITNIQFIDQMLGKWFLVANNADVLPKCLQKYQSNKSLSDKLNEEKIEDYQIENYLELFGSNWNRKIGAKDISLIENSILNGHSFITITYLINDQGKWFSSSIIREWHEYDSNNINQKITLPTEIIENGKFSLNIELIK